MTLAAVAEMERDMLIEPTHAGRPAPGTKARR